MERRTYKDFSLGVQENSQEYRGGIFSGADIDLGALFGVIQPSSAKSDSYSDSENLNLQVDTFTADGTWTCPDGVTSAIVECWGAGGGSTTNTGGGGGGAYSKSTVTVVPTTGYAVVVGTSAANTAGEDSTFNGTTVVAKGGASGATGTGGAAGSGTGDTKYSGGNGSTGTGNRGGGGGAGDGGNGSNGTGGAGTGGDGGATNGGTGATSGLGGNLGRVMGGGGASETASQAAGGRGEVRITYQLDQGAGYPVIKKRSWGRLSVAGTSHAITMPSGIVPGNLLIIIFSTPSASTITTPSGWTLLNEASNTVEQAIYYKIATGGDTATVTTSASIKSSHVVYCIAGGATPTMAATTGNSTNPNPPSHTSGSGTAPRLWIVAATLTSAQNDPTAAPSGYNSLINEPGQASTAWTVVADAFKTSATENPGTFTQSLSGLWCAATIAVEFDPSSSVGTNTIIDMEGYNENDDYDIYALVNSGSTGKIIARTANDETAWSDANYIDENPTGGMRVYNSKLFWGTTTKLGSYDGTTFTNAAYTLKTTQDSGLYMPMEVFSGNLYVGNMRYVGKLDPTPTWDDDALILPAGFKVIDMRVWNDRLAILAQRTGSSVEVRVFFWDGVSATYDDVAQLNDARPMALYTYLGALLVFGINGNIYQYRGTAADGVQDFEIVRRVPGQIAIKNPSAILMSNGEVLFGVLGTSANAIGIWAFGRQPGSENVILYPKYIPKGDYKYDPGNSDYYSVTSLLNVRVNDSQFNPSETGSPATVTADSSAGDSTWTKIEAVGDPGILFDRMVCSTNGNIVLGCQHAVGSGKVYRSEDGGDTWEGLSIGGGDKTWVDVCISNDGTKMAAAEVSASGGGYIWISTDGGDNWTQKAILEEWLFLSCDDDMSVIAAGVTGAGSTIGRSQAYISTDTGTSWTIRTIGTTNDQDVLDICMSSTGATMYAAVEAPSSTGNVRKSTNTGSSWSSSGFSIPEDPLAIDCSTTGSSIIVGTAGDGAYQSTNSGSSWTQLTAGASLEMTRVAISEDATKILLQGQTSGDDEEAYYSDDSGSNWSWLGSFDNPFAIALSGDGTRGYVGERHGDQGVSAISAPGTGTTLDDNIYVVTGSKETGLSSFYLKGLNPSFSVDNGETITGISVDVTMKKAAGTTSKDVTVKLVKGGSIVGDNKGANTDRATSESTYTYGSSTDLWGTTWTPAEVNATDFGVVIQAANTAAAMAIDQIVMKVYWEPSTTAVTQREYLYAALQRGNATEVSETMVTGIVNLTADGFATGRIFTAGEDLGFPDNDKTIMGISINCPRPLNGSETITVYSSTDNTENKKLSDISWTQIAQFGAGTDQQTRYITPFSCRRLNLQFVLTPNDGTPETPPGLISYTLHFRPIGPFLK